MRVGVLLIGALLVVAPMAAAQQPVAPKAASPQLVGPFLVRDLLKLLEKDPFDAAAARNSVTATAIRSARDLGRRRNTFGLASFWASARRRSARQAASALNHPHICTIYEVGEHEGHAFIVMEHVEGKPLSALIPTDGLPPESVIRYGTQIADALAHAHERGIVHRDLKPQLSLSVTPKRAC